MLLPTWQDDVPKDYWSLPNDYSLWLPEPLIDASETLASIKKYFGFDCRLLIVDQYGADAHWHQLFRDRGIKVIVIDDLANRTYAADLLTDCSATHSMDDYVARVPKQCRLLLGSRYVLLRPEFAQRPNKSLPISDVVEHVLVSIGATDPMKLTPVIVSYVHAGLPRAHVHVLATSASDSLEMLRDKSEANSWLHLHVDVVDVAALLRRMDLAVGSAGMSAWERCAVGLPSIIIPFEKNQRAVGDTLNNAQAAALLPLEKIAELPDLLETIASDTDWRAFSRINGLKLCDGKGVTRVVRAIQPILS